jgi:hypothetical protein
MNLVKIAIMTSSMTILSLGIGFAFMSGTNPIVVLAQQNNTNSSSTPSTGGPSTTSGMVPTNNTLIGNTIIPTTTNGTTTTTKNATGVNATGVNPMLLAKNITAGNALLKENTTAPVSPTGISTNAAHLPPSMSGNATTSSNASSAVNSSSHP